MLGFIVYLIVIGLIAGFIARALVPGRDPMSVLGTMVLGIDRLVHRRLPRLCADAPRCHRRSVSSVRHHRLDRRRRDCSARVSRSQRAAAPSHLVSFHTGERRGGGGRGQRPDDRPPRRNPGRRVWRGSRDRPQCQPAVHVARVHRSLRRSGRLRQTGNDWLSVFNYYRGTPPYRRKGAPHPILRITAPLLVLSTISLLGAGIVALAVGPRHSDTWITIHQGSAIAWATFVAVHLIGHALDTWRLTSAELRANPRFPVGGREQPWSPAD